MSFNQLFRQKAYTCNSSFSNIIRILLSLFLILCPVLQNCYPKPTNEGEIPPLKILMSCFKILEQTTQSQLWYLKADLGIFSAMCCQLLIEKGISHSHQQTDFKLEASLGWV